MPHRTELGLDPRLQDLLRCPQPHHAQLIPDPQAQTLTCVECGTVFPVRDGIPILLMDEAVTDT